MGKPPEGAVQTALPPTIESTSPLLPVGLIFDGFRVPLNDEAALKKAFEGKK